LLSTQRNAYCSKHLFCWRESITSVCPWIPHCIDQIVRSEVDRRQTVKYLLIGYRRRRRRETLVCNKAIYRIACDGVQRSNSSFAIAVHANARGVQNQHVLDQHSD